MGNQTNSESERAAASTIEVQAIDHVTTVVNDLERSRKFYRDLLGMGEIDRPDFGFPGYWFQAGSTQVHLILNQAGCSTPGCSTPGCHLDPETVGAGLTHHFAFEVEDADDAHHVLTAAGVRIQGGPATRPDGCTQVWFYDPDGHCVEVFHRPAKRVGTCPKAPAKHGQ